MRSGYFLQSLGNTSTYVEKMKLMDKPPQFGEKHLHIRGENHV